MITYLKLCHQRITAACVLSLAALTIPVKAQVIVDLSVVTCGQYMSKDRDTQDVIAAWMSGNTTRQKIRVWSTYRVSIVTERPWKNIARPTSSKH